MINFGAKIGQILKGGETIELVGDVGAGKTTFTKGLATAIGVKEKVQSPSFTISRYYEGEKLNLAHYDFYRLADAGIMADELAETINDPKTITVIEWAETVAEILPKQKITVKISIISEEARKVEVEGL